MRVPVCTALMAALAASAAWSQEIQVSSATFVQMYTQETPGFEKKTYMPAMEFLGIDATHLGSEALSLHLFGWGRVDLRDQSLREGKSEGALSYGYLKYRFANANAEVMAGRFAVNQGVGIEQVDGVSAKVDLVGDISVSAFGGRPVLYKPFDESLHKTYEIQRDAIFGARVALRNPKGAELGVSFLQDGTKAAQDLKVTPPYDYTRKQLGVDLQISPSSRFDFSGRTVFDVAKHPDPAPGIAKPSTIAEHDYSLSARFGKSWSLSGTYTERNFFAYYAGTTMPSLFRQVELNGTSDRFKAYGGRLTWGSSSALQVTGDFRHTDRLTYGKADRWGAELRWTPKGTKVLTGFSYHRINASDVLLVSPYTPSYSLSHKQVRAWMMYEGPTFVASADGIMQVFDDERNIHLNGRKRLLEIVGSGGWKVASDLKLSTDLIFGTSPIATNEVRGLVKVEYRFGFGRKGGQK